MKIIETKEMQVIQNVTVRNETICDKCGCNVNEGTSSYDAYECDIKIKTGDIFPEVGFGVIKSIDLCKSCSKEFLELLIKNGYSVNSEDWDY